MPRKPVDPRALAVTAVMTAIVFVLTSMIRVPTPARGYIHLGDAGIFFSAFAFGPWIVDVWWEALLCTLVGVPVLFISLYLMNGAAFISGRFTRMMLDKTY